LQLDLACHTLGIQEVTFFSDRLRDVFPRTPETKNGMLWSNEQPGLGIDVNEDGTAFPFPEHPLNGARPPIRRLDRRDQTLIR
jgi:mannonate dehydratase